MAEAGGCVEVRDEAADSLEEVSEAGGCAADLVEAVNTLEELVEDGGRWQYDPKHKNPPNSQRGQSLTV